MSSRSDGALVVAVVGSRDYPLPGLVRHIVACFPDNAVLHVGRARGVDSWAEDAARNRVPPLGVIGFPPDYDRYPKHVAPLVRNGDVVRADAVVAFWDLSAGGTNGTGDALTKAFAHGAAVTVYDEHGALRPDPLLDVVRWRAGYDAKKQAGAMYRRKRGVL